MSEITDNLRELLAKATPGPIQARHSKNPLEGHESDAPTHLLARVYQDDQGRRCTSFLSQYVSTTEPNEQNADFHAALLHG